jgi:5-formyltetrahydrofolate cyclo-ligase
VDKPTLRKLMKHKLKDGVSRDSKLHGELSLNLKQLISKLKSEKKIHELSVGVYSPIEQEPKWFKTFSESAVDHYLVVHMHNDRRISYHSCEFDKLISGEIGLKLSDELLNEKTPDFILVPGLAFTNGLERLGRGKGYFDSYLENFKGVKIGVFFSMQEVDDVFQEEHDQKLDYLVTEKDIIIRGI